jgi:phosphomannomutase
VRHRRAQGGIAITASHNPAEWNALKFIGPSGLFLNAGQARELLDIYHQGEYTKVGGAELRTVEEIEGATDLHITSILDALGPLPQTGKKLRVVLDSCNGAGSLVGPKLIEALGAEVIPLNTTPDGSGRAAGRKSRRSLPVSQRASGRHRFRTGHGRRSTRHRL